MSETTNIYSSLYQESKEKFGASDPGFISKLREDALNLLTKNGFPGKKDEHYKYSFLEPYFSNGYNRYLTPKPISFDVNHLFRCDVPALDTQVIILLNGFYFDKANPLKT